MKTTATATSLPQGLIDQVMALTPEQREELAEIVGLTPDERSEEEWQLENIRRMEEIVAGRAALMSRQESDEYIRIEMQKEGVEL